MKQVDFVAAQMKMTGIVKRATISVQAERAIDVPAISDIVRQAYERVPYSNHREQLMIERLRASSAFVPELSLVARVGKEIDGHVLLTKIAIRSAQSVVGALSLAPLSVLPAFQLRGVGSALVNDAHRRARLLDFSSIVLIGIPNYYRRFGYVSLKSFQIAIPFAVPESNCMILPLSDGGIPRVSGIVEYPTEWLETSY